MCGIVGMVANGSVNQALLDALTALQHRGQDAAGIVTTHKGRFFLRKSNGMVADVFAERHMQRLRGKMGIGHVRYPTAGSSAQAEAQPFYVNHPYGISLGHNGNLTNVAQLRERLLTREHRNLNTDSDSEVLLNLFASELQRRADDGVAPEQVFAAVTAVHEQCHGAYAAVALVNGVGVVAFRDPFGIRPLCIGVREGVLGKEYMVASESVALDAVGFTLLRDVEAGEAVVIDADGQLHARQCARQTRFSPCLFEYVYLARPDSIIDGVSVYKSRLRQGERLAQKIKRSWPDHDIDVVVPVPDTSRTAALQLAGDLGIAYREGFIKNRYIARTFIMPGQSQRQKSVRRKLNPIALEFRDKNVLIVDDSIVRGTTSRQIVQLARDAGARRVYFASAAPPVRYQNVYGIDMPTPGELIAHNRTEDEVGVLIGADRIFFQDLADLQWSVSAGNPAIDAFDGSCFDGHYVTGNVDQYYLDCIGEARSDARKQGERGDDDLPDRNDAMELIS